MLWKKSLVVLIEYCVYLLLFCLPLLFSEVLFLSYELPKLLFFRSITLLLLFLTAWRVIIARQIEVLEVLKCRRLKLILLGLVGILLLSNLFAIAPKLSFWGNYFRLQGSYTFLHYWLFFILLVMNFHQKVQWERALMFLSGSLFLLCVYAILQGIGWDFTGFNLQEVSLGRSISSAGQPNYLASFVVMAIFPVMAFLSLKKRYLFAFSLLALSLWTLFLTGSRAAAVGLAFAVLLFTILSHFFLKKQRSLVVFLTIMVLVSAAFFSYGRSVDDKVRSVNSRIVIWETTIEMLKDAPIFGYGLDSFSLVFPRYSNGDLLNFERSNTIPDRAHNNVLDILFSNGIFAFALLVAAWVWFLRKSLLALQKIDQEKHVYLIATISSLSGISVANLFSFSMTLHFVMTAFLLGFWCFLVSNGKTSVAKIKMSQLSLRLLLIFFGVFSFASIIVYNLFFLIADRGVQIAYSKIENNDLRGAHEVLVNAAFFYPHQSYIYYLLAAVDKELGANESAENAIYRAIDFSGGEDWLAYFQLGEIKEDKSYCEKAYKLSPTNKLLPKNTNFCYND